MTAPRRYAAAAGGTLGSCSGGGSRPAKATKPTGEGNVPRAAHCVSASLQSHCRRDRERFGIEYRGKDLADAEFWTGAGLETL